MSFNLIRFFRNYVDFCAEGMESEKLLGKALKAGIVILRPKKKGFLLKGKTEAKKYPALAKIARKSGVKIKITKKSGPYFTAKRNGDKIFLAAGSVLAFSLIMLMNCFVWDITVKGSAKVPKETILESAYGAGLKAGTLRKSHNVKKLEWQILNENDMLAWVTVNIVGCKAEINVTEVSSEAKMMPDDDKPVNIIAERTGVIRAINVYDGFAKVKVGDVVKKGDLLVGAVFEDRYNKLTLKHARAEVIAETGNSLSVSCPLEETTEEKGEKIGSATEITALGIKNLFGKNNFPETCIKEQEEGDYYFLWIKLPISRVRTTYFAVKENHVTHSEEEAAAKAGYLMLKKELEEMKGMTILSKAVEEKLENGSYTISAEYMCLMDIAEEQDILSNEPWENTDDMS